MYCIVSTSLRHHCSLLCQYQRLLREKVVSPFGRYGQYQLVRTRTSRSFRSPSRPRRSCIASKCVRTVGCWKKFCMRISADILLRKMQSTYFNKLIPGSLCRCARLRKQQGLLGSLCGTDETVFRWQEMMNSALASAFHAFLQALKAVCACTETKDCHTTPSKSALYAVEEAVKHTLSSS